MWTAPRVGAYSENCRIGLERLQHIGEGEIGHFEAGRLPQRVVKVPMHAEIDAAACIFGRGLAERRVFSTDAGQLIALHRKRIVVAAVKVGQRAEEGGPERGMA